ncbi:glycoside hydrolase family 13 protein [Persicitalea sp.]|uniref:glycoside hydrolase family 13 protein n=1 Tax=Persicitalea sp. TaxID=3100273 RepID=UPI0035944609
MLRLFSKAHVTFLICLLGLCLKAFTQPIVIDRIAPLNWWVGMKDPRLQIIVHGENLAAAKVVINYPGLTLVKENKVDNPNYLILDLTISPNCRTGTFNIELSRETEVKRGRKTTTRTFTKTIPYELRARTDFVKAQGVDASDLIYLLLPDRFANGDPSNDKFADMADTQADRSNPFLRHGGDLQGIIDHLDYFKELGVTALWLNPVIENDQPLTDEGGSPRSAYHGYGFTDHYQVDRRLGGNDSYKKLVDAAHANGLKIVQDAVYNHAGVNHWLLQDSPAADWLHQWPTYTNTSYKEQPVLDPYASKLDQKVTSDGWFVPFLPDWNQNNTYVKNYLLQHAIWTVEYFGIDTWRVDTYMYNDLEFMNQVNAALLAEYPNIHIFGENWTKSVPNQAYFQQNHLEVPFKSNLPGACDFQTYYAINDALNQEVGWDSGVQRIYATLGQDYLYENPMKNVVFLDNHDTDRYLSVVGENMDNYRMGIIWLLTTRGIPQLYYGTEILMKNFKDPSDAEVRRDFPGGFIGDKENKFAEVGRTNAENEAFDFIKKLANYRKNNPALHSGKLTQFLPMEGVYVYFRYDENKTIMVIMNSNKESISLETGRFRERLGTFATAIDVLEGSTFNLNQPLKLAARTAYVFELGN